MNSREKGKRGERQWRDELRANGYNARRGQQFCGSPDSPDVMCDDLDWIHFEVKAVERLNIEDAMEQARGECGGKVPVVAHKKNFRRWLVTMDADAFFRLMRGALPLRTGVEHRAILQPNRILESERTQESKPLRVVRSSPKRTG